MIVTFADGRVLHTSIRNCTGYVASKIEIEPKDITYLCELAERPVLRQTLVATLRQLEMRFQANRVPLTPHVHGCPARDGNYECRCAELGGYL